MRDWDPQQEQDFFSLFLDFFDTEKDAGKQHDPANYSLDRMYPLAELAGNPEKHLKLIHVAGTKGKGSTCHFISALLTACGKRNGLFTSPHLCTVRERFQIDNTLLPYHILLEEGKAFVQDIKSAGLKPSLFEIFTLLAMKIFVSQGVEWAVLETGIGGRLDATNYIHSPQITAIAPVSFDHQALLGNTIEEIAGEKAGIIKANVPLVLSKQPFPEGENIILQRAKQLSAPVLRPSLAPDDFLPSNTPFFLKDNFNTAYTLVKTLGFQPLSATFKAPRLRARFECIQQNPMVILDGAHNGDSMEKLVEHLQTSFPDTKWNVVLGSVQGKDICGIVAALAKLHNASFILTNPSTSKASALAQLELEARKAGLHLLPTIPDMRDKSQLPTDKPLLFTGSFFTALIGEKLWRDSN